MYSIEKLCCKDTLEFTDSQFLSMVAYAAVCRHVVIKSGFMASKSLIDTILRYKYHLSPIAARTITNRLESLDIKVTEYDIVAYTDNLLTAVIGVLGDSKDNYYMLAGNLVSFSHMLEYWKRKHPTE